MVVQYILEIMLIIFGMVWIIVCMINKNSYNETTTGTVVGTKWKQTNNAKYPLAIVEFEVGGQKYRAIQHFKNYFAKSTTRPSQKAERWWEVDDKYRIHYHVVHGPAGYAFSDEPEPLYKSGENLTVYYQEKNPNRAYCGVRANLWWVGMIVVLIGILLLILTYMSV